MNMGRTDRIIRGAIGVVALLVAFFVLHGGWQIALWVIGGIMLATGLSGICPAYYPFHFSTKK